MTRPADIASLRHASALRPDSPQCLFDLANALLGADQTDEAIDAFRQAVALRPDFAQAWNNMGVGLKRRKSIDAAAEAFAKALALRPDYADAHVNLGNLLCARSEWDRAIECFHRAIALRPDFADAHGNLGNALFGKGDLDGSMLCYHQAMALRPDNPGAHNNLANALCGKGDLPAAMAACRAALALRPDFADAHLSLALMLLLQGDFERGWAEYEWRWKAKDLGPTPVNFPQPRWDGGDLNGRRILLHAEQGFGDTIQFVRYVPLVARRGGRIILACPAELLSLLRQIPDASVTPMEQALPEFDVQCPLLSLPGVLQTRLNSIPANAPYLQADSAKAAAWSRRLPNDRRLKIGLAWAGRPTHRFDRDRSVPPAALAPLAEVRPAMFVSLQKSDAPRRPCPMEMADWTDELHDFGDTSALIHNLDLVITADTAVAHLAGAMAKPVWVLLPFAPDWRWMLDRRDSPWYPTMRLFRQPARGDWRTPVQEMAEALRSL